MYFKPKVVYPNPKADKKNSVIKYIGNRVLRQNKNFLCGIVGATGCLPKGFKVLMADGSWKEIQEIKIGDVVLSPQEDGTNIFSKVINLSSFKCYNVYGVYQLNKQKKKLYECSKNHLIPFYNRFRERKTIDGKRKDIGCKWRFKEYTSEKVYNMYEKGFSHNNIGFSSFPIEKYYKRTNCKIEPYTLGVFLGDGMFQSETSLKENKDYNIMKRSDKKKIHKITHRAIIITSNNPKILQEISKHYPIMNIYFKRGTSAKGYAFSLNGDLSNMLTKYGLEGKKSGDKFIPKEAMFSDLEYRKKLLTGLIDMDGSYSNGGYSFTLKSKQLIENIKDLVYSIGGRTGKIRKIKKKIKSINFEGTYYSINIYLKDLKLPLLSKHKIKNIRCCYLDSNRIAIITKKEKKNCMVYGFELDSPSHWFVTNNWMVTGNSGKSYLGLSACEIYSKMFNIPFDPNIHIISSLKELLQLITAKDLDKKMRVGTPILFDEPQNEANSRAWQSEVNQAFNSLISTFRNQRLVVFFALPYLEMIDKQSRLLFHCEIKVDGFNKQTKITTSRPRFLEWNKSKGEFYRKRLVVEQAIEGKKVRNITLLGSWHVPLASKEIIDVYEAKKKAYTDELNKKLLEKIELREKVNEGKNKADEFWKIKSIFDKYGEDYLQVLEEMPNLNPQTIQKYFWIIKKSLKLIKEREQTSRRI